MNILFFLMSLMVTSANSMVTIKTPADFIKDNIMNPKQLHRQLTTLFRPNELVEFRDENYNNIIHLVIQELIGHKHLTQNYQQLQEECKPLLEDLVATGVSVSELNDFGNAPCFFAYSDNDTKDFANNFLRTLGAYPIYFSFEPELRAFKKAVRKIFRCECFKNRKQE